MILPFAMLISLHFWPDLGVKWSVIDRQEGLALCRYALKGPKTMCGSRPHSDFCRKTMFTDALQQEKQTDSATQRLNKGAKP
jgi:hypothetical protein